MNLEEYVAVSGIGGVYKLVNSRPNGLILEDLDSGKTNFYPLRKHQFTPMGSVAIYTLEDTIAILDVFKIMKEKYSVLPAPTAKEDKLVLQEYFEQIVPDYDEDRVYLSDIKKVLKWFNFLHKRDVLNFDEVQPSSEEE